MGAHYWLGHGRQATRLADELSPVAGRVRDALPYGRPALELLAICALIDDSDLDAAHARAQQMAATAAEQEDPFAAPRAEYCLARIYLARGRTRSAARSFRRCLSALAPFDQTLSRHLHAMVAHAEALAGDAPAGRLALEVADAPPGMPPYDPDWGLAEAAVSAAELNLGEAADQAAYVAEVAATRCQWNSVLRAGHDAVRYGAGDSMLTLMRRAAGHTDSALAPLLVSNAEARARDDAAGLDCVSRRLATAGQVSLAVEAATCAAIAHTRHGDLRAGRSSAAVAERLRIGCEDLALPWLVGFVGPVPLTRRENEVAVLASAGWSDAATAANLGISVRTVQAHLVHVYDKLGIHGRHDLREVVINPGAPR